MDWFDADDDEPRWERRPRRDHVRHELRDRRLRIEQIIAMASLPPAVHDAPVRRPLHLIWGPPVRSTPGDTHRSQD